MPPRIENQAEPIPGYRLIERLGGGGFGEVWKAEAPGGLLKAIKFVYGDLQTVGDSDAARAEQELKALSRVKAVRHPFILSLERFDIVDGQLMIVSELADRNLWDRFRECRSEGAPGIPRDELLKFMQETAEALDHMNLELDLMHLDIKPQNLFLVGAHVKVADFGLVKDLEGLVASVTGGVTPVYAAPETFEGYVSRFSDQYSLAIVYQELLTAQRPFNAANTRQLILAHLQAEPDLSALPVMDRPMVGRALAKDPSARYPSSQAFVLALREAVEEPPLAKYRPELQDTPFAAPVTTVAPVRPGEAGPDGMPTPGTVKTPPSGVNGVALDAGLSPLQAARAARAAARAVERVEETGAGVLMPALVIGLGQVGRTILERFRAELRSRLGNPHEMRHLRLLAIDTDPQAATTSPEAEPLAVDETLLTRLSRPSRYLRPRAGFPSLDDWLEPMMIYRIPRDLVTNGVRALGRLAFIDNYRAILARLRWELEGIARPEAVAAAKERTGLALRSSWPAVYIVTHLGGGTGGGIFLDLAYVVRGVLRELHIRRQDLHGVFVLPKVEEGALMDLGLANTYAALAELGRYMSSGHKFRASYEARVPPHTDDAAPFTRCVFLSAGMEEERERLRRVVHSASDWLYRELFTPLGRTTAEARGNLGGDSEPRKINRLPARVSPHQSMGQYVLAVPRRALTARIAQHVNRCLLDHWAGKAAPELAEPFRKQMRDECIQQGLDPQTVLTHLNLACQEQLGKPPDVLFKGWLEPLQTLTPFGLPEPKHYHLILIEADRMLGPYDPKETGAAAAQTLGGEGPTPLPTVLRDAADAFVDEAEPRLVRQVLRFVDEPGYRLGAAEEAINQTFAGLEDWLQILEKQLVQVAAQLAELPPKINRDIVDCERTFDRALHGSKPSAERKRFASAGLPERIQRYFILRYQFLTLQWAIGVYRSLRGRLSDQKKELSFCRNRLRDLQAQFADTRSGDDDLPAPPQTTLLLPDRAANADEIVDKRAQSLTAEDWTGLDAALEEAITNEFGGLFQICLSPGLQPIRRLRACMQRVSEGYLDERLQFDDVAALFAAQHENPQALTAALQELLDSAAPEFMPAAGCTAHEVSLVLAPETPSGAALFDAARKGITGVQLVAAPGRDELVFYREISGLMLTDLPQFGPIAREAYDASFTVEHFTPHARQDVPEWAAKKKEEA